nr:hypothetical protein [Comamonas thiooxydans]
MPRPAGEHPFKSCAKINERDELIARWLDPDSPDTKVIDGVAPTFKQLANALSAHFAIRTLSEAAVRQYVQSVKSKGHDLLTRSRGRPTTAKQLREPALPKRPRGRPKKADVKIEKGLNIEPPPRTENPLRRPPTKAFDATFLAQLTAEAVQLTGLSPNALHRTFSSQDTWKKFLGERSSFFYRLQKKLDAKHLAGDTSSRRPDDDTEHSLSLRLHQLTLPTLEGLWCAVLLAYEPRSHFLNAACYVAHPVTTDKQARRLSGRPVKLLDTTWRPTLTTNNSQTTLHLPADALIEFVFKTRKLMAVPVDAVYLSSSLGNPAELIQQLQVRAPERHYSAIPKPHQSFIPPETGKLIRVTTLRRQLENLLNSHYREVAFAKLNEYQHRLDKLIEESFHIKKLASGRQRYKERKRFSALRESDSVEAKRQQARAFVEFRTREKDRLHVQHRLRIVPVHLACDDG